MREMDNCIVLRKKNKMGVVHANNRIVGATDRRDSRLL